MIKKIIGAIMIKKIISLFLLSIILIFSGCITVSENDKINSIKEELIIGISYEICGFYPWSTSYDVDTMSLNSNIFNSLIELNNDIRLTPSLATYWSNIDNLTWRFYLREGVKFHNGYDFTAEDVKYTIDSIRNDSSNDFMTLLISIKDVAGLGLSIENWTQGNS